MAVGVTAAMANDDGMATPPQPPVLEPSPSPALLPPETAALPKVADSATTPPSVAPAAVEGGDKATTPMDITSSTTVAAPTEANKSNEPATLNTNDASTNTETTAAMEAEPPKTADTPIAEQTTTTTSSSSSNIDETNKADTEIKREESQSSQPTVEAVKSDNQPILPEESPTLKSETVSKEEPKQAVGETSATQAPPKEEIEEQIKDLIVELEKDEKDEIQAEKGTEELKSKLEQQQQQQSLEKETQKMIDKVKRDEVKAEQDTAVLIQKLEQLQESAAQSKTDVLPELSAPTPKAAAKASTQETNEFLGQLKKRLKADEDYVSMLDYQKKRYGAGEEDFFTKLKDNPAFAEEFQFFEKLQERIQSNREFKALYDDFLGRLKSRQ
eukprot:scaffold3183_cov172-Amphora_coffeaeformis.AAC.1